MCFLLQKYKTDRVICTRNPPARNPNAAHKTNMKISVNVECDHYSGQAIRSL